MIQQTAVEWFLREIGKYMDTLSIHDVVIEKAKEIQKKDCINFSIEWENRRDDEDIKSKEDLYDLIFNK